MLSVILLYWESISFPLLLYVDEFAVMRNNASLFFSCSTLSVPSEFTRIKSQRFLSFFYIPQLFHLNGVTIDTIVVNNHRTLGSFVTLLCVWWCYALHSRRGGRGGSDRNWMEFQTAFASGFSSLPSYFFFLVVVVVVDCWVCGSKRKVLLALSNVMW